MAFKELAVKLRCCTKALHAREKTDPDFPPIVWNHGRKFFVEEDTERYVQAVISRGMRGR